MQYFANRIKKIKTKQKCISLNFCHDGCRCGAGKAYPSGAPDVHVALSFVSPYFM